MSGRSSFRRDRASRSFDVLITGQGQPAQGGIPRFLDSLRKSRLSETFRVDYLNLMRSPVFDAGRFTLGNVGRTVSDAWHLWRRARHARLIHVNSATVPLVTMLRTSLLCVAGRLAGARVMLHVHSGLVELWLNRASRRLLARVLLAPADHLVAASEGSRRALAAATGADDVALVDNGIDVSLFRLSRRDTQRPVVASAGFLTERKGTADLIEASRVVRDRGVEHELFFAGDTIPESGGLTLDDLVAEAGSQAHFLGYVAPEDMPEFYRRGDVFCLASWWEAMPISVLEAMAAGLPVLATTVGDIPRAVEDGETGFLVPTKRPDLLADALERLLRDPDLRTRMGDAGRRRVERKFSLDATIDAMKGLYRDALS